MSLLAPRIKPRAEIMTKRMGIREKKAKKDMAAALLKQLFSLNMVMLSLNILWILVIGPLTPLP